MTIWVKVTIALAAISLLLGMWLRYPPFMVTALLIALTAVVAYLRHRWDEKNGNISS